MNRRDFIAGTVGVVVVGRVAANTEVTGKSDNRNPWSTGLYPLKQHHLVVFDDIKKARGAFEMSIPEGTWDAPLYVSQSPMIWKSGGRSYRYAVVRNIDEAYHHAGNEYRSIAYMCDVDPHIKEYLNSRVR